MESVDLEWASGDAHKVFEQKKLRLKAEMEETDAYLRLLNMVEELMAEVESLQAEVERKDAELAEMKDKLSEEKEMRTKLEMEMKEMKTLSAGVAGKASQEALIKAISAFVNRSKRKKLEKRAMVKSLVMELVIANELTLPKELRMSIDALDDEMSEEPAPVMASSGTFPKELDTNRARNMLDRAVERKLLTEVDYQRREPTEWWKLACLANEMGDALELKNKWVVFATLWGKDKESLRKSFNDKYETSDYSDFKKKTLRFIV